MATALILGSGIANYIEAVHTDFPSDLTDAEVRKLLIKAIRRVNLRIGSSFEYFSVSSGIAPTPTEIQGDIIVLQAECMLSKRRYAAAVSKGISIKEGDTSISTTGAFSGHRDIMSSVCQELEDIIAQYLNGIAGAVTNGDIIWHGNTNTKYDHHHNGDEYHSRYYESPYDY